MARKKGEDNSCVNRYNKGEQLHSLYCINSITEKGNITN